MEKTTFDFEAFKKDAAERIKKGDTLLSKLFLQLGFAIVRNFL